MLDFHEKSYIYNFSPVNKKHSKIKIKIPKKRILRSKYLGTKNINELRSMSPKIFKSKFMVTPKKAPVRKKYFFNKKKIKLLYKLLRSKYKKCDAFTANSSYNKIFSKNKCVDNSEWQACLEILLHKRVLKKVNRCTNRKKVSFLLFINIIILLLLYLWLGKLPGDVNKS